MAIRCTEQVSSLREHWILRIRGMAVGEQFSPRYKGIKYLWWQKWVFQAWLLFWWYYKSTGWEPYMRTTLHSAMQTNVSIMEKKTPQLIAQIRESILWASPGLNSVLIPSDRHFIFNNNHLLLRLCALSNLAVGGHSIPTWLAGGWLCVIGEPSVSRQIRSASSALLSRSGSGPASFVICVLWTNGLSESRASVHLRLFLFAPSGW